MDLGSWIRLLSLPRRLGGSSALISLSHEAVFEDRARPLTLLFPPLFSLRVVPHQQKEVDLLLDHQCVPFHSFPFRSPSIPLSDLLSLSTLPLFLPSPHPVYHRSGRRGCSRDSEVSASTPIPRLTTAPTPKRFERVPILTLLLFFFTFALVAKSR